MPDLPRPRRDGGDGMPSKPQRRPFGKLYCGSPLVRPSLPLAISPRFLRHDMGLVEALILGIVQGLTEFLPISSSAHLRIVPALSAGPIPGAAFTAVIQIGTLAAVLAYFRDDILRIGTRLDAQPRRHAAPAISTPAWAG